MDDTIVAGRKQNLNPECGHQTVAGLTSCWDDVCFGLQQCGSNVYWSTRFTLYGIRKTQSAGFGRNSALLRGESVILTTCPG